MKLNKTTAVVLAVLLTLVVLGTIIAILTGWFHPVIKVTGMLLGCLMLVDLSLLCSLMGGAYDAKQ